MFGLAVLTYYLSPIKLTSDFFQSPLGDGLTSCHNTTIIRFAQGKGNGTKAGWFQAHLIPGNGLPLQVDPTKKTVVGDNRTTGVLQYDLNAALAITRLFECSHQTEKRGCEEMIFTSPNRSFSVKSYLFSCPLLLIQTAS